MIQMAEEVEDWRLLLRGMRSHGRSGVPQAVIALALGVAHNTVARWASGSMTPPDYPHVQRVRWLAREAGAWYRRFVPVLAVSWKPGSLGENPADRAALERPGPEFGEFNVYPLERGDSSTIVYDFRVLKDYPEFTFLATGKDRGHILLSAGKDGSFHQSFVRVGPLKRGQTMQLIARWAEEDNVGGDRGAEEGR